MIKIYVKRVINPVTVRMTGGTTNATTPPPLYHNLRGTNQPATSNSENGAPPSYEEAINPNGNNLCTKQFYYQKNKNRYTYVKLEYNCNIYNHLVNITLTTLKLF